MRNLDFSSWQALLSTLGRGGGGGMGGGGMGGGGMGGGGNLDDDEHHQHG